ncbi:MAG: hypothetical protein ACO3S5_13535 [Ilumatobacteraceae bacterium]
MTTIIVAVIGGAFGLVSIWLQARVHKDNRSDHAKTAEVVDSIAAVVGDMRADQIEIKADLREVKADLRDHSQRLRIVEAVEPVEPPKRTRRKPT